MTGRTFGRLTVIRLDTKLASGECQWLCECACGETTCVAGRYLRTGRTQSCGCLHRERSAERCVARNKKGIPQRAQRGKRRKRKVADQSSEAGNQSEREHLLRAGVESGEVLRQQDVPEFCSRPHRFDKDDGEPDKDHSGSEADGTVQGRDKTLALCRCAKH